MVQLSTSWQVLNSKKVSYYNAYTGNFQLWARIVGTQDIANNRTKVEYQWYHVLEYGWITADQAQDYVTGAGWNSDTYREYTSTKVLRSWEGWISHNADGTGNGSCSGRTNMSTMGVDTDWVSASYTLPTIPRASVPTASPSTLTIGSSGATLTVNTNRKSSSFTHTIKVQCGSWSWTSSARSVGASTTCTIPYSVIGQFGSSDKTKTATVYCDTYNGTTHIGDQKSCTVTLQIDTTYDYVTIDNISISDVNARTSAITQDDNIMISNISTLQAVVECGTHGSYTTLYHAVVTCGNVSQTFPLSGTSDSFTFTFDKVNASSLKINLMSNRSTGTTQNASWTLIAYQPVTAVATVGRPSATGSVGVGQLTGMAYGGNFGGKNLLENAITMYGWGAGSGANITGGVATLNGTTSNWNASLRTPKYPASLYDGSTTYTLSYDYKSTASCSIQVTIAGSDKAVSDPAVNRTKYVGWGTETVPSSGGTWARRTLSSRTIAVSQLTSGSGEVVSGFLQFYARTDNVQFQIRNVQLEKGSTATSFSSSENVLTVAVDFKKHDDPDYDSQGTETAILALTQDGYNSYSNSFTFAYTLDYQYQYDIKFTVSDLFSTATYVAQLMQGLPIISWDENEVDVFGNLHIHDRTDPYKYQDVMNGFDAVFAYNGQKNLGTTITSTRTNAGVTFTPQSDGSMKVVGTASQESWSEWSSVSLDTGTYIISGSVGDVAIELYTSDGSTLVTASRNGEEITFTVNSNTTYHLYVEVPSGATVDATVYPMIRDARIASDEFVPWMTGRLVVKEETTLTISSGYTTFNYPTGITNTDYFLPIIQSRYSSSSTLGWTGTTQKHGDNACYIYVRQGTTTPANNTKITFDAIWIHR